MYSSANNITEDQNLYHCSLYGTPSRHVLKMTPLVVMWMRFELVVHIKSEIWASLPYSFTKKVLLQLPGE